MIQGKSTLDELMMNLIASHEVFSETVQVEMGEALEREERERVRSEQEAAFEVHSNSRKVPTVLS